jgi:hypothetical protein
MKGGFLAAAFLAMFSLTSCSGDDTNQNSQVANPAASNDAANKAADVNQSALTSCDWQDMEKQRLNILSWTDEADVCTTMQSSLGRFPSVALARELSKAIFVMQASGDTGAPKDIAYQMMNIVEARDQVENDKAIASTFETVTKIFNGTQGHVTPKDLNVNLRSSGPMAKTMSDDGLIGFATIIWEDKKTRGE